MLCTGTLTVAPCGKGIATRRCERPGSYPWAPSGRQRPLAGVAPLGPPSQGVPSSGHFLPHGEACSPARPVRVAQRCEEKEKEAGRLACSPPPPASTTSTSATASASTTVSSGRSDPPATKEEREAHELAQHCPPQVWCEQCQMDRGKDARHELQGATVPRLPL